MRTFIIVAAACLIGAMLAIWFPRPFFPPEVREAEFENRIVLPGMVFVVVSVAAALCYWLPRFRPLVLTVLTVLVSAIIWMGGQDLLNWHPILLLLPVPFGMAAVGGVIGWWKGRTTAGRPTE